jgi:hypothetical protein
MMPRVPYFQENSTVDVAILQAFGKRRPALVTLRKR